MRTVKQSAEKLGVSLSKMYEILNKQRLAHYRIEGKIMVATRISMLFSRPAALKPAGKRLHARNLFSST
jgi:hypothetical protein